MTVGGLKNLGGRLNERRGTVIDWRSTGGLLLIARLSSNALCFRLEGYLKAVYGVRNLGCFPLLIQTPIRLVDVLFFGRSCFHPLLLSAHERTTPIPGLRLHM